ncbi:BppU family phage baseplate upper protein [Schleiferilactobacillus harbinensis]|uniref:BppU family phage baseplate upper protein n=1 Tax=Schleiferilactobacillus harbinensis TaxID=304207 RepID=UPI00041C1BBB|nr:BppU family phage baseplate upper protein [Schleiferilactobacillus harbinensis]
MTLPRLTLTMDKREKSQQKLHLRQSERGLSLTAELSDYNGAPYDLTGMLVRFKDAKAGGKSVSDDNVTIANDPKTGVVTYPVHSQVFAANGIGWFEIFNSDGTLVDSTQNIPIVVDNDISGTLDNSDYISGLSGLKAQLQGIVNSAQQTLDNAVSGASTAASNANQAAQAAQALANDIPNDPKYKGTPGKDGKDGKDGLSITISDKAVTAGDMTTEPDGTLVIDSNDSLYQAVNGKWVLRGNIKGSKGDTGTGIQLKGSADSTDKLPATGNTPGDTYVVQGHLYIWENDVWTDGGELQGPKGDDGRSAYQVWLDSGHTGTQADFLATLKGADGKDGTIPDLTPYLKAANDAQLWSGDLDTLQTSGRYWLMNGITNAPITDRWWLVIVIANTSSTDKRVEQIAIDDRYGIVYYRMLAASGWSAWQQLATMAAVSAAISSAAPDLSPYLKSADAANTYQTATQVQAVVDAKVVPVADEATATSNSATHPTALYVWPEV